MTPSACWTLFGRTVKQSGSSVRSKAFRELKPEVKQLGGVCLGDFNAIRGRSRSLGTPLTGEQLLVWLRDEVAARGPDVKTRVVGFVC